MKTLKDKKRESLSNKIAKLLKVEYPPILETDINGLVKRMAVVNRLGNLLQEYMMLDYYYKNPVVAFEMVEREHEGVVQPCYVPAINVVRLDTDLVRLYTMEDIYITLLHELRHKWQLDQVDYAVQIPSYEKYLARNEKDFDMLWSKEKDELDADNFAYYYSKKILRGKPKNKNHSKLYKFKLVNPAKGTFNYFKGHLRFAFVKHKLKTNPDLEHQNILYRAKKELSNKNAEVLVCDRDKYFVVSLALLERLSIGADSLAALCERYSKIKPHLKEVDIDNQLEIDYESPTAAPIELESLLLYLYDYQEEIKGAGINLSMYNYYFRYAMEELDPSPELKVVNEYAVAKINEGIDKGLVIETKEDLFELTDNILEARKRYIRNNITTQSDSEQIL